MGLGIFVIFAVFVVSSTANAAPADVADAAMRGDRAAIRAAVAKKANVNVPQVDGSTALHWAVGSPGTELEFAL